ncbi:hypothetical protein [Sphingobacterium endophyticum]|uniref:hypothetical protein n=1 Tax=Sphingobacterium endophyticum TaxID=2546448 RepID=UPI0012E2A85E|nr:hypothetical protein [Sphingobacterium endophyticum]
MRKLTLLFASILVLLFNSCSKDGTASFEETIVYEDNFNDATGIFWTGTKGPVTIDIKDGYYNYLNEDSEYTYHITIPAIFDQSLPRTAIEARYSLTNTGGDNPGSAGLIFNYKKSDKTFYRITLNGISKFRVDESVGEEYVVHQDWLYNKVIKNKAMNVVRVELRNDKLIFFINGTKVYEMVPEEKVTLDECGFIVSYHTFLKADYFKAYRLM